MPGRGRCCLTGALCWIVLSRRSWRFWSTRGHRPESCATSRLSLVSSALVREIVATTRQRYRQAKSRPLGVRRILLQDPHARPERLARSPAPRFHAATWQIRRMLEAGYRAYRDAYRHAMLALQGQRVPVPFPLHGIPPPLNLVTDRA